MYIPNSLSSWLHMTCAIRMTLGIAARCSFSKNFIYGGSMPVGFCRHQPKIVHSVQNAAVYWLQAIFHVWQRSPDND